MAKKHNKKRIFLITGASGFIGANLTRKLITKGEDVHLLLRKKSNLWRLKDILKEISIHYVDLLDFKQLKKIILKIKPTIIYHLATYGAYSYQDESIQILNNNIIGTWNLLQAVLLCPFELFVNTGSSSEYGFKNKPMKETDLLEPNSYYAISKSTQTHLCSFIAKTMKKPIVTLRPFSVYGPFETPIRFTPTLMTSFLLNKKISLVSPNIARDFIYIDDFLSVYFKINKLKKHSGECFNLGSGKQITIKQFVNTASKVIGKKIKFAWGAMPDRSWDSNSWIADISKAKKLLSWKPKYNLEQGIKLFWLWFKKNKHYYL